MISQDDKDFLHIDPILGKHFPIYAETHINKAGTYRIWVELKTKGKVRIADFTVNVKEGKKQKMVMGNEIIIIKVTVTE